MTIQTITEARLADVTLKARFLDLDTRVETAGMLVFDGGEDLSFRSSVVPAMASEVLCYSEIVGRVTGMVMESRPGSYRLRPTGSGASLDRVYRRLSWLREHGSAGDEMRQDVRFVPDHTAVAVKIAGDEDGTPARIVDLSRSGVAVETDLVPAVGSRVYVGRRGADVVRVTDTGFAARFAVPLPASDAVPGVRL